MVLLAGHPKHWHMWGELLHSVRTGEPAADHLYAMPFFDYLPTDAEYAEVFNNAMTGVSEMAVEAVLGAYEFSRFEVVAVLEVGTVDCSPRRYRLRPRPTESFSICLPWSMAPSRCWKRLAWPIGVSL
jgi:hypothetical protein